MLLRNVSHSRFHNKKDLSEQVAAVDGGARPCLCVLIMVWTVSDATFWLQRRRCLMCFYDWVASWIAGLLCWSDFEEGREGYLVVATHFVSYQNISLQSMVDGWETSVCVASCCVGSSAQLCVSSGAAFPWLISLGTTARSGQESSLASCWVVQWGRAGTVVRDAALCWEMLGFLHFSSSWRIGLLTHFQSGDARWLYVRKISQLFQRCHRCERLAGLPLPGRHGVSVTW